MNEDKKDALNDLINSIQEKMNKNVESSDNTSSTPDISSLLNTLNLKTSSSEQKNQNNESKSSTQNGIDPTLFLKIQQIMSAMNSSSPQKDLLMSLKPFLRKSRQDKMTEYLTILNILSILESFKNNKGSD